MLRFRQRRNVPDVLWLSSLDAGLNSLNAVDLRPLRRYLSLVPFPAYLAAKVDHYALRDLQGDLEWHIQFFDFLGDDDALQRRLGAEFFSARYIYKLLEGLHLVASWSTETEVRLQVFQYASIYEAALHHLLFRTLPAAPEVRSLLKYRSLKPYSVPAKVKKVFAQLGKVEHDGKVIIPAFLGESSLPDSKVRFEDKVGAAVELGLIKAGLGKDLRDLYEVRNTIHIHAELKKNPQWAVSMSRTAYRRLKLFREQVWSYLA